MGDYRPSHVGLCVRDLDRSLRFFCDGLGFDKVEGFELDSDVAPGLERSLEVPGPVKITSQFIQNDGAEAEPLLVHAVERRGDAGRGEHQHEEDGDRPEGGRPGRA